MGTQLATIDLPYPSLYRWQVFQGVLHPEFYTVPTLDVGCNNGGFLARIVGQPKVGLDRTILPEVQGKGLDLVCADATCLPFAAGYFQQIIVFDLIEHVENDRAVLHEASRVLASDGIMWISTPARDYRLFPKWLTARAAAGWGHVRNGYTAEELSQRLPGDVQVQAYYWNEPMLRTVYMMLRLTNNFSRRLARFGANLCYKFDRHYSKGQHGHLLARVTKAR